MKKILVALTTILIITFSSCTKDGSGDRIGCVCNDGTSSGATGSGACSGHGGVSYWLYR